MDKQAKEPWEPPALYRVQTSLRMERRILKVLKATGEYLDIPLSYLVESIVLHAFDGECFFTPEMVERISQIKKIYGLNYEEMFGPQGALEQPEQPPRPKSSKR